MRLIRKIGCSVKYDEQCPPMLEIEWGGKERLKDFIHDWGADKGQKPVLSLKCSRCGFSEVYQETDDLPEEAVVSPCGKSGIIYHSFYTSKRYVSYTECQNSLVHGPVSVPQYSHNRYEIDVRPYVEWVCDNLEGFWSVNDEAISISDIDGNISLIQVYGFYFEQESDSVAFKIWSSSQDIDLLI